MSGLRRRLLSLAGIVAIVGVTIGILAALGLFGSQGGGEGIRDAKILDPRRDAGQDSPDVGPQVGKLAPDFEISSFDGSRHRMGDFRGKTVYVNFWATWCGYHHEIVRVLLLERVDVRQLRAAGR